MDLYLKHSLPFLFFLGLLLNPICPVKGQTHSSSQVSNPELIQKKMQSSIEFTSLLLKTGEKIQRELGPKTIESMDEEKLEKIIKPHIEKYLLFIKESEGISEDNYKALKTFFSRLKRRPLVEVIKNSQRGLELFFKRNGIGVAVAITLGQVVNYVLIYASYLMGLPQIIPIVQFIPFSWFFSVVPSVSHAIKVRKDLIKILGGEDQFKAYQAQMKLSLNKIKDSQNLVFPLFDQSVSDSPYIKSLVINRQNWKNSLLSLLGIKKDLLTLRSLKQFIKKNGIHDSYIERILKDKSLSKEIKSVLASYQLLNSNQKEVSQLFQSTYSSHFQEIKMVPQWEKLEAWTQKLLAIEDIEKLRRLLFEVPIEAPPEAVLEIINQLLIPSLAGQSSINYKSYRSLKHEFQILSSWTYQDKSAHWNKEHIRRIDAIFSSSLSLFPQKCSHPEAKILELLSP